MARLSPERRFAVDALIDLSRLVRAEDRVEGEIVRMTIRPGGVADPSTVGTQWGVEATDGEVSIPERSLDLITALAGAGAEQTSSERDRFGRVPPSANPLVSAATEREPLVSRAAVALRRATAIAARDRPFRAVAPWPNGRRWAVGPTFDVDVIDAWWPAAPVLRAVELGRRGLLSDAARVLGSAARALGGLPAVEEIRQLVGSARERGIVGTWFFLCGTPTLRSVFAGDLTYLPEGPRVRGLLGEIADSGAEIGLHGSLETHKHGDLFAEQRSRLERAAGVEITGIRQHFLSVEPGATHRLMRAAGFGYDATYGFPDRSGFRLGLADVIAGWDGGAGAPSGLDEVPLHWMDRSFTKYQRIEDPARWFADARELWSVTREVEGLWVGLWHPTLTSALGFPRAEGLYLEMLSTLLKLDPYVDRLDRLVSWRRARRSVRAERIEGDGSVRARASERASHAIFLEDAAGELREQVATS